MFFTT
jgi:hypothetical protein